MYVCLLLMSTNSAFARPRRRLTVDSESAIRVGDVKDLNNQAALGNFQNAYKNQRVTTLEVRMPIG